MDERSPRVLFYLTATAIGLWLVIGAPTLAQAPKGKDPQKAAPQKTAPGQKDPKQKKKKDKKQPKKEPEDDLFGDESGGKGKRQGPGKGVRGMFDNATVLYDAGRYGEALIAYDALLRKYPGHEPAIIQTAKSLYRLDRIKEAFNVFARVNPQHLDPETSYEYGWSFYTNKQWEGGLRAFQRVPKGHALFDLANYYGAICAIKIRKYEDAEDMLEKAVVLPDKLAKSRTLYIKHVQALRLMQQKSALSNDRRKERDLLQDKKSPKAPKDAPKTVSGEYQHQGFKGVDKAATVKYAAEHRYIDNHGLSETNFDAKVASFELLTGFLTPVSKLKSKDRVSAAGVQLSLGAEDRITKGKEQRILIDETADDLTRVQQTDLGTTDKKAGKFAVGPWIEFPLPEAFWLALGSDFAFTYPEFERGGRSGTRGGYLDLAGKFDGMTFFSEVAYTETLDTKTEPTVTIVTGLVSIGAEVMPKLTGKLKASHDLFDYLAEDLGLDGPDSATRGEVSLSQALPFGFSASVLGAFEQQANYVFHGIQPYGQLAADGQAMTARVSFKAAPFPWISAEISELLTKTTWKLGSEVEDETARNSFELNVPDYVEVFTASVAVNMAF